jgi:hypothetical protein
MEIHCQRDIIERGLGTVILKLFNLLQLGFVHSLPLLLI